MGWVVCLGLADCSDLRLGLSWRQVVGFDVSDVIYGVTWLLVTSRPSADAKYGMDEIGRGN